MQFRVWLLALLCLALMPACGTSGIESPTEAGLPTSVAQTVDAFLQFRAATQTAAQLSATPTATFTPTATSTATLTPTPEGPIAILLEPASCRAGPDLSYPEIESLQAGLILAVMRTSDVDYVLVLGPGQGELCWLSEDGVELNGVFDDLPIATIPPTPTPSLTPTPNIIWRGEWQIWVGPTPLTQYTLSLTHEGLSIQGSFDAGSGNTVNIDGALSADYSTASGIWTSTAGGSGTFEWRRKINPNQFVGNLDGGSEAWCGARAGASLPDPCLAP